MIFEQDEQLITDGIKLLQDTNFQYVDENPYQFYKEDERMHAEKIREQEEL
jgi:hypothetical protein